MTKAEAIFEKVAFSEKRLWELSRVALKKYRKTPFDKYLDQTAIFSDRALRKYFKRIEHLSKKDKIRAADVLIKQTRL